MCGIVGMVYPPDFQSFLSVTIEKMCQVIHHRGPDDQGIWIGSDDRQSIALGMRRLSIIDRAGGHQPIFNEDRSMLVICNGEIYNYRELQTLLRERGHHFTTKSDTEVIIHAYEEFGDKCVEQLRGMFSFILWDQRQQRLFAARDRFGKKPLNYYWDGHRFLIGSEIKSLLEAGIPRRLNPLALDEFLVYRYIPTPLTIFHDIWKLPAGHTLTYKHGQIRIQCYWEPSFEPTCNDDETTAIERIKILLEESVRLRLMSEVSLGAFLSGGIDSSIVVGLMSQLTGKTIKTFSIGFQEQPFNELPYARQVAKHFQTDHYEFLVPYNLISILPQLVWAYDEPFADSSMLPTYYVSKLAREHVTVALTGDGGDEIFGGYQQYAREYQIHSIPASLRRVLAHLSYLIPDGVRGKKRLQTWLRNYGTRSIEASMLLPNHARSEIYSDHFYEQICEYDPMERHLQRYRQVSHLDATAGMQYVDTMTYLPDDILTKVDKASMLNSLETRSPLLDHVLAEYVTSLRPSVRLPQGQLKYLLKHVGKSLLPTEILQRRKQGFAIPIEQWFRKDVKSYAHDILNTTQARNRGIFHPNFISHFLQHDSPSGYENYGQVLWTLLCLELWFQTYMDPLKFCHSNTDHYLAINTTGHTS